MHTSDKNTDIFTVQLQGGVVTVQIEVCPEFLFCRCI